MAHRRHGAGDDRRHAGHGPHPVLHPDDRAGVDGRRDGRGRRPRSPPTASCTVRDAPWRARTNRATPDRWRARSGSWPASTASSSRSSRPTRASTEGTPAPVVPPPPSVWTAVHHVREPAPDPLSAEIGALRSRPWKGVRGEVATGGRRGKCGQHAAARNRVFFPPPHFERKDEKLERERRAKASARPARSSAVPRIRGEDPGAPRHLGGAERGSSARSCSPADPRRPRARAVGAGDRRFTRRPGCRPDDTPARRRQVAGRRGPAMRRSPRRRVMPRASSSLASGRACLRVMPSASRKLRDGEPVRLPRQQAAPPRGGGVDGARREVDAVALDDQPAGPARELGPVDAVRRRRGERRRLERRPGRGGRPADRRAPTARARPPATSTSGTGRAPPARARRAWRRRARAGPRRGHPLDEGLDHRLDRAGRDHPRPDGRGRGARR